jgi:hypothetical protein
VLDVDEATGWIAAALVVAAGAVPLGHRALRGKRGALTSPTIRSHVVIGVAAAGAGFAHALAVLPSLGSPEAIGAGGVAIGSGAIAFLLLVAHVGVGLKLRSPKLRERPRVRRTHLLVASAIVAVVAAHVVMLVRAG